MLKREKISTQWIDKTTDIIKRLYPNDNIDKIKDFVSNIYETYNKKAIGVWRSIYTYETGEEDIDDIMIKTIDDKNTIVANGSVVYTYDQVPSLIYNFLNTSEGKRKIFKKQMLEAGERGDKLGYNDFFALQYKHKERMNSAYGVQTQRGSIVANTDSASAITLQARELISEMMWSIEKFLMGNCSFYNSNELFMYIDHIMNQEFINKDLLKYIDYYPTATDCIHKLNRTLFEMNDRKAFQKSKAYEKLTEYINNLSNEDRVKLYYKDNLFGLVDKNKIFKHVFEEIFNKKEEFLNPYDIPDVYKENIEFLWELCDNFVFSKLLTYKRVEKYINRTRRCVLMSDTDSIMICLDEFMDLISDILDNKVNVKTDQYNRYKLVNVISSLLSKVCNVMCYKIGESANAPENERHRLAMKNEFYFLRMILRSGVKKNYSTLAGLQEGKIVPEKNNLLNTGGNLTSSNLVPEIREKIEFILKEYLLKPDKINPLDVWKQVMELENHIKKEILSGNKNYSLRAKYGGMKKGYSNPLGNDLYRGVTLWNRFYKELGYDINPGESVLKVKTIVKTEEDAIKYIKDPIWLEKTLDLVFDKYGKHRREFQGEDFSSFGLSSLCINATPGLPDKIPEWLIPIIDIDNIVEMHLKPISDLLVSIGLYKTKINSSKSKLSTLVNFS